jgi:hypothetical protein
MSHENIPIPETKTKILAIIYALKRLVLPSKGILTLKYFSNCE